MKMRSFKKPIQSFEDLRGLRAVGYIRDSKLDQREGYGPDIQKNNEVRFAESYGLVLCDQFYTEFVSGRSMQKRKKFQQIIEDAGIDLFDVLLVDHTSRFGRNQGECIRYKDELQGMDKTVIFVSQGIISGSDRDFLSERINETLDEAYSRNLSRFVREGFAEKAAQGNAIGKPPFGYKTEKSARGRGARHVVDRNSLPTLLAVLEGYTSNKHSFRSLAQELNTKWYRTSHGKPFTESSISNILNNRFYQGEVVYHGGRSDEEVFPGAHDVPKEIKELWLLCQEVRMQRNAPGQSSPPSRQQRVYPLTGPLVCDGCGRPFHGIGNHNRRSISLRMVHSWHRCDMQPQSVSASGIEQEFSERVLGCLKIDEGWQAAILGAMSKEGPEPDHAAEIRRIEAASANLRKQHLWNVIGDEEFKADYQELQRQKRALAPKPPARSSPNLNRAAGLLSDLPALWKHPGVTQVQRRELAREAFDEIRLRDGKLVAVKPRAQYAPLFAYSLWNETRDVGGEHSP